MNLSHKLTFSIFSILLVAGLVFVPTIMAADGGPTITSIVLDTSQTVGDSTANPAIPAKDAVSGNNALLTTANRVDLHPLTGSEDGYFQVIVTFSEDVYPNANAKPGTSNAQVISRALNANDLTAGDFEIVGAGSISDSRPITAGIDVSNVTRKVKTTSPSITYEPRIFIVTIRVDTSLIVATPGNLPLTVALKVRADQGAFSIGTNDRVVNGVFMPATLGVDNQESAQYNFTVVPRPISTLTVTGQPTTSIRSHQPIQLTLTFSPGLHVDDVPTRDNIAVTNADIKADDISTTDKDEGIEDKSAATAPRTKYQLNVQPRGGLGNDYTITIKNKPGTSFVLDETIQVNNAPAAQRVNITGTVPSGGAIFTVRIVYTVAPATPLTVAGVTVTNATIVANSFTRTSSTEYSLDIDPTDPTAGNPVTVTVRVGSDFKTFVTSVTGTTPTPTPGDPHVAVTVPLTAGLDAGEYLVVTPSTIVYDDPATATVDESVNTDVLPSALAPADRETQATVPDLEELLYGGGTIDVYVDAGSGNTAAKVIINEVMWALDENEVGTDGHTAHQWIELYNKSTDTNATAGTITLRFKPRSLDAAPTNIGTRTDRLSNVLKYDLLNTGWSILNKGQSGNSHPDSTKEFKSMYRKGDNGIKPDSWGQSTLLSHVKHRGTPGKGNTRDSVQPTTDTRPGLKPNGEFDGATFDKIVYLPPKSHVLINEVHNNSNNDLDWLELRFLQNQNLENWTLSYVKSDRTEHEIMRFPKRGFNAGDIVLIVNKDPQDTNLAEGQDVTLARANQARGAGPHKYWNPSGGNSSSAHYLDIPDHNGGAFFLILRTKDGYNSFGSRTRMHDAVGTGAIAYTTLSAANPTDVKREPHTKFAKNNGGDDKGYIWETLAWPINGHARGKGLSNKGINAQHSNNSNSLLQTDRKFAVGSVFARNGEAHGIGKNGIYNPGNKGGLGYDRNVVASGTPGYDNGVVKNKSTDLAGGTVVVSEIMLTTDSGRYPQWLELHNTSNNTVDLHADTDGNGARQGWSIRVENHRSDSWNSRRRDRLNIEVKFRDLGIQFIPPNQTILITGDKVRNSSAKHFPNHRVASIWEKANGSFKMENRRDIFLNLKGFRLEIVDGSGQVSDAIGNLDGKGPDVFNPDNIDFDNPSDNGDWNWPSEAQMIIRNRRTSLIRLYDDGVARTGTPDGPTSKRGAILPIGIDKIWFGEGKVGEGDAMKTYAKYAGYAWVHAVDTKLAKAQITWYGSEDDYGTPLHTTGTPLPVELSFFRPTLENGKVTIQWTTESELDNAGFNILRSDTRNGEFTKVNEQMIQGNGTTAERSTYKWVDTTAKPGVVYYYQIEDVSFAGQHNILATTKLKGLISAKGKLTTQWGELKNLR